ncbi:MAG: DUF72 domain-containing protein [bacterium]
MKVRVGVAGWDYKDWHGKVYPDPMPRGIHPLDILSVFLDCVEINSSFYGLPNPRNAEKWVRLIKGKDFTFEVKLYQGFTHDPTLLTTDTARQFKIGVQPLKDADKLDALLVQFPESFHHEQENLKRVKTIHQEFSEYPLVYEMRHKSWAAEQATDFIAGLGGGLVSIDFPFIADPQNPPLYTTGRQAYIRFHGRNRAHWYSDKDASRTHEQEEAVKAARYDYQYSGPELDPWVRKIKGAKEKADKVTLMFNNHFNGQAVANAIMAKAALTGALVAAPDIPIAHHPSVAPYVTPIPVAAGPPKSQLLFR